MHWEVPETLQYQEINARILWSHTPGAGDPLLTLSKDMPAYASYHNSLPYTLKQVEGIWGTAQP